MDHDFSWRGTYTSRVPPRVAVARTAITRVAITRMVITHVAGYYTRGWLLHAWLAITHVANTRVLHSPAGRRQLKIQSTTVKRASVVNS